MTQLFYRNGKMFNGTPSFVSATRTTISERSVCGRCGGAGGSDKWAHTGWTCYQCNGSGKGARHDTPLYTQEKLDKLNAIATRKSNAKQAAHELKVAQMQQETDARRAAFEAQHADVLRWLRAIEAHEGFLFDMCDLAARRAAWSEAQTTAIYAARERALERERVTLASQHVGNVGDRLRDVSVVVEHVHIHENYDSYGRYDVGGPTYITTMRDDAGNCIVVMSSSFHVKKGDRLVITGSVSDHNEFRGQMQTRLKRVKIERHILVANVSTTRKRPNW